MKVFNKGTPQGLKGIIERGGQTKPISKVGDKLEWKKAQKKARKNMISETIKRIIPKRKPIWTEWVWNPRKVDSRTTSRHQRNIDKVVKVNPKNKTKSP